MSLITWQLVYCLTIARPLAVTSLNRLHIKLVQSIKLIVKDITADVTIER